MPFRCSSPDTSAVSKRFKDRGGHCGALFRYGTVDHETVPVFSKLINRLSALKS